MRRAGRRAGGAVGEGQHVRADPGVGPHRGVRRAERPAGHRLRAHLHRSTTNCRPAQVPSPRVL